MHIVLHLVLEVALEEVEQVVLNVDLLDLIVDSLKLCINFIFFHAAKSTKFSTHFDDLVLFLVLAILLALFVDLGQHLWLDEIELEIYPQQAAILFD